MARVRCSRMRRLNYAILFLLLITAVFLYKMEVVVERAWMLYVRTDVLCARASLSGFTSQAPSSGVFFVPVVQPNTTAKDGLAIAEGRRG